MNRQSTIGSAVLGLAAALVVSVVAAAPAHAADTARPTLGGGITFAPATVDTTTGDATSTVSVPLNDDTGVTDATLTLTSPDGSTTSDISLDLGSGTAKSGVWTGTQTFSAVYDAPGTWAATSLVASDATGSATITSGLGNGIVMTRTTDTTAPTLTGASATTTAVDTTSDPATVLVRVQAKDDLSGVAGGVVTFTSPDGDTVDGNLSGDPVQGSVFDGSWDVPVVFPVRTTPGTWRLTSIDVSDAQYNDQTFDQDDAQVPSIAVKVTTADDTAAPSLTSFSVGPAKRSTGYGTSGYVYAQVGFSDATSGVASVQVTLQRPNGVVDDADAQPAIFADSDMRSGTSRSGTINVPVFVENFTAGTWKTASVTLADNAGNTVAVATAQLPGSRTTFDVSTAKADTTAPTSTGYAFSPNGVDTRLNAATGTVLVAANDPDTVPSGVASGTATLTSPSGLETAPATFTADSLAGGDQANGTFRATYSLPRNSEDGAWTVSSITVVDGAGRSSTQTSWASTPSLTVLGKGRAPATPPGAPGIGTASVSGTATTASVSWTPPTDNGGAKISRYRVNAVQGGSVVSTVTSTASPVAVPNLRRGQTYTFTVAAENVAGVGTASQPSNAVTIAPGAPTAPTIGRAELSDTTATVTWTAPTDDGGSAITGYRVTPLLDGTAQPAQKFSGTTATVTGLARGRTYAFRVAAENVAGVSPTSQTSNSVSVAAVVPAAPQVTSTSVTGNTITVRWAAPYDGGAAITGYTVTGSPEGTCASTGTACTVTGLTPNQAYTFTVVATNRVGSGNSSDPSASTVADVPLRPTATALTSVPSVINYGTSVTVTGRVSSAGDALGGQLVALQYRRAGTGDYWATRATTRSASNGTVRFTGFRPTQSVSVRLVTSPSAPYVTSASSAATITVRGQVTIGTRTGTAKRGSTVTISGRANPARPGAKVTLQRWSKGAWRTVASKRLASSGYSFRVKMSKRGTYSYRVVTAGDRSFAGSSSPARSLRVK